MIILLGNKKDLDADREVTFLEASRFAQENGKANSLFQNCSLSVFTKVVKFGKNCVELFFCTNFSASELMFLETSATTGENVEEAFLKCSRTILSKIDGGNFILVLKLSYYGRIYIVSYRYFLIWKNDTLTL